MSIRLAIAVILVVAGCGSSANDASTEHPGTGASPASRVDRCTDRLLERVDPEDFRTTAKEVIRRYAEKTYCSPFEKRGWIYDDGTLSIGAQVGQSGSEICSTVGGETRTVPCEELERRDEPLILDCALLHVVRRSEVRKYVEELQRNHEVSCDDGTPLDELGAR